MEQHKLFSLEELKNFQATGKFPVAHSHLLEEKYSDRWKKIDDLFEIMNHTKFVELNTHDADDGIEIEDWADENIPDKSFAKRNAGPTFSYDVDTMIGPHDWENDAPEDPKLGDYVIRKKLYITQWTGEHYYDHHEGQCPELEYFIDLHKDFKPVLDHYAQECYKDQHADIQRYLYKLMVIQYTYPVATEETLVSHRKHNTERFGPDHCDETLGGLHLGENYREFQAQNTVTDDYEFIPGLDEHKMLWMFGEDAERSGWKPTFHQMIHNPTPGLGTRYSLIFDLNARYIGE